MDCGTWMQRDALAANASSSPAAIDDALADLVLDGLAEYRMAIGYRLAGTVMTRKALRLMRAKGARRGVYGQQVKGEYRVGVAEQYDVLGLVMYELALPMPEAGPEGLAQHLRQVDAVMKFSTRGFDASGF